MASANRYPGIDPRIVRCVRHHAARVRAALPGMEIEDVEQELMLHVHRRLSRFDAARGSLRTFADRVARNCAANLLQSARSERRGSGVEVLSLDTLAWHADGDGIAADADDGAPASVASRRLRAGRPAEPAHRALAHLRSAASALRSCFLGLFDNTVADAARRAGVSRSTMYARIAAIRESFQAADLQLHLAVSDTFEVFPVSE